MESKHTPGPWVLFEHERPNCPGEYIYGVRAEAQVVHEDGEPGPSEILIDEGNIEEANGRLIAAAPEMLEALEECAKAFALIADGDSDSAWSILAAQSYVHVVGAIDKAKGGNA